MSEASDQPAVGLYTYLMLGQSKFGEHIAPRLQSEWEAVSVIYDPAKSIIRAIDLPYSTIPDSMYSLPSMVRTMTAVSSPCD